MIPTLEQIWRQYDSVEQRLTTPVTNRMLDLANLRPGMHVLDLATGRGEPAIPAAHRIAPNGTLLGLDLSEEMLQMTRERAAREGLSDLLDLRALNAEQLDEPAHFHVTLSRWGLMYFESPVAALTAARRAMVPSGGVLVAALWAEPERVPYFTLPRRLLAPYRPVPPILPDAPGTFRYATMDTVERDFAAAGFTIDHVEEVDVAVMEAQSAAEVVAWTRAFGLTRLLNELPEAAQQSWEADLAREVEPLRQPDGFIRLGGFTRLIVASPVSRPTP